MVGWLGADEFEAVLPAVDAAPAEAIGHGRAAALVDEAKVGRRTVRVSASIGLAVATRGTTLDEVLSLADRAMYGAKRRSRADVPNRIVRIFLEHAGEQYDRSRGLKPYSKMTDELLDRSYCADRGHRPHWNGLRPTRSCRGLMPATAGASAYCAAQDGPLVEEHVVPINRESVGLHAWGNLVPACKPFNAAKRSFPWKQHMAALPLSSVVRAERTDRIGSVIAKYRYEPDVEQLRLIVLKLYDLSDRQTRGLLEFGLLASAGVLQSLHGPAPVIGDPAPSI